MMMASYLFELQYPGCNLSQFKSDFIQFNLPLFEEHHLQIFRITYNGIL